MQITEDRKELFKAISAAQGEFTTVEKNGKNPHFNSKFAPLDSIIEMIRPVLPRHGLSVVQFTDIADSGNGIVVETIITHESGQYISGRLFMPAVKNDPQGYGSALTYGRRYALAAALGIVSDEDVDGNATGGNQPTGNGGRTPKSPPQAPTPPKGDGKATPAEMDSLKIAMEGAGYTVPQHRANFIAKHASGKKPGELTGEDVAKLIGIINERLPGMEG